MHYYGFNIGDYRRDTYHLTMVEHGIYRTLIDSYYLDEKPIPNDNRAVMRRLGLGSDMEPTLVNILNDFFILTETGWHHKRIDADIDAYRQMKQRNKSNGSKGGRPKSQEVHAQNNPVGYESEPSRNPVVTLTNNHKPITNNQEPITINQELEKEKVIPSTSKPFVHSAPTIELGEPLKPIQKREPNMKRPALIECTDQFATFGIRGNPRMAEKFFNYYESNGWRVGKNPMKNWKMAARNWFMNESDKTNKPVQTLAERAEYWGEQLERAGTM